MLWLEPKSSRVPRRAKKMEFWTSQDLIPLDCIVKNGDEFVWDMRAEKGRLWQDIVSLMPPHDTYIETHLGGGAVMRNKRPARVSIGVDIDPGLSTKRAPGNVPGLVLHSADALAFLAGYAFEGRELLYVDPPMSRPPRKTAVIIGMNIPTRTIAGSSTPS